MKTTIKNLESGQIITIDRSVTTVHPAWVHAQLGTESEGELQDCISQFNLADFYRGEDHIGRDAYGVEMIAEDDDYCLRISDGNAMERAGNLDEAESIVSEWYEFLTEEKLEVVPAPNLDASSIEALNDSIRNWEQEIARAMGAQDFAGHGHYFVRASDSCGLNLTVTRELKRLLLAKVRERIHQIFNPTEVLPATRCRVRSPNSP